jgi:hypothetical protein
MVRRRSRIIEPTELHARALAAVMAYAEMPYAIRRRRWEPAEQSAERIRLSDHFSAVKVEMRTCEVLIAADGDRKIAAAYRNLISAARGSAGWAAREAWNQPAIREDAEMNMQRVYDKLKPFHAQLERFEHDLARATLPRRKRLRRRQLPTS